MHPLRSVRRYDQSGLTAGAIMSSKGLGLTIDTMSPLRQTGGLDAGYGSPGAYAADAVVEHLEGQGHTLLFQDVSLFSLSCVWLKPEGSLSLCAVCMVVMHLVPRPLAYRCACVRACVHTGGRMDARVGLGFSPM
jgi:hypothetical protein